MFSNTDKEWEKFGKNDPYFGVLTDDKFHKTNLTEKNKEEFFATGFDYINDVLNKIKRHIDPDFTVRKAIDFGCGVGRLVIPLAGIATEITGIDVSDSMLDEARKNCAERSIKNAIFIKSDDTLSELKGKYNFIHSFIVFQHIPVTRGEKILNTLIAHLEDNGVCVLHFTYNKVKIYVKLIALIKQYIPLTSNFINLIRGRSFFSPQMQMNPYDVNQLLLTIQKNGASSCYIEFTNHSEKPGVIIYFKKTNP